MEERDQFRDQAKALQDILRENVQELEKYKQMELGVAGSKEETNSEFVAAGFVAQM